MAGSFPRGFEYSMASYGCHGVDYGVGHLAHVKFDMTAEVVEEVEQM